MLRIALLASGLIIMLLQQYFQVLSVQTQSIVFLGGIVLLGVPHGAADLLVAYQNAADCKKSFSKTEFFFNYLGRLILFAILLWFFPLVGNLMFIIFAAYHFGETDLYKFKTDTLAGKIFVISYGLLILGVILLHHFEEVKPLFNLFNSGTKYAAFINWLDKYRYTILSFIGILFFASTFVYFSANDANIESEGYFIVQLSIILIVLYTLPMVQGFTFYFVVWHSVLSLRNIINYLRKGTLFSFSSVARQIGIYSIAALAGLTLFGLTGFMFVNGSTMMVYVFLALAVLTAPHMQIMHGMYKSIRTKMPPAKTI